MSIPVNLKQLAPAHPDVSEWQSRVEYLGHAEGMGLGVPQTCGYLAASLSLSALLCLPPFSAIGACQVSRRPVLVIGRLTS